MSHIPVMLKEAIQLMVFPSKSYILDCTFGGGGHSRALLEANPDVFVVALDCDPQAGVRADALKKEYPDRFTFHDCNFSEIEILQEDGFTGILFDLGVSSFQLDIQERGFSFRGDAPVDMRLNPRIGQSAAQFLERAREDELVHAIRDLGEEFAWKKVVKTILRARGTGKLENTSSLAALIEDAVGRPLGRRSRIHPATKSFQGIRMAVNHELESLDAALPAAYRKLCKGGILAAISFHSLEDRLVKRFFRRLAGMPEHKGDARTADERSAVAELLTKQPVVPSDEEVNLNPRSRSAKLRAIKKIEPILDSDEIL